MMAQSHYIYKIIICFEKMQCICILFTLSSIYLYKANCLQKNIDTSKYKKIITIIWGGGLRIHMSADATRSYQRDNFARL